MGNVMLYSGIVTKVRAMQAKLLKDEDFENIAGLRSIPAAVEYLKGKPAYAEALGRMDETLYHRGNVEKVLGQSLFADYSRIYQFAGMKRIVFNHYDTPFDLDYKKEYFDRFSQISIDKLVTSENIRELVENLKGTEYYEPLWRFKDAEEATLYDYNMALDLYYFRNACRKQRKMLNKEERELFTRDCGVKIDLLNLQWIYRAKKYYHMLPTDIYQMMIPIQYRLSGDEFKALVEAPSVEQFIQLVSNTYYKRYFNPARKQYSIEQAYKDCLHKLYMSDRRRNPYSIATVNTYLFLKEEEIDKLITALECIRYGLTQKETLEYLGGVEQ